METEILVLEDYKNTGVLSEADLAKLRRASEVLQKGGLVAFPTETVYGLGGDALNKDASRRIYAAKGRPSDNPLIVHISGLEQLACIASRISPEAMKMARRFWPGPLTMVFPKAGRIPRETTGGLDTVAVRFPSHPAAKALIAMSGTVIAAPSANRSGRPSTTNAAHCIEDLTGRVDMIVDGGPCDIGLESTILDVSGERPVLLRPGAVTAEMIEETLGIRPDEDAALQGPLDEGTAPKAPGMKYRHYAPQAPMVLVAPAAGRFMDPSDGKRAASALLELLKEEKTHPETDRASGMRKALLCSEECLAEMRSMDPETAAACVIRLTGSRRDEEGMARVLFERLRELDAEGVDFIAAEGCSEEYLGKALMNRMKKAAAWQVVYV